MASPLVDHAHTNVAVRVTFNVGSYTQACVCQLHGYTWYKPILNMTTTSLMLKGCGKIFQYKDNHCMIVWGTRPHGRFSGFTILVSMATGCPCSRCRRTNSVKDKMSSNQSALVCVHLEQSYRVLWPLCALLRSSRWQSYSGQSIAPLVQSLKVVRLMLQKQQQRFCLSLVLTEATIILQQRCCSQGMLALYLRTVKVCSTTLDGPLWRLGSSFDFILSLGICYGCLWVWGVMVSMCLLRKPELARTEQSSQGIFRQPPPLRLVHLRRRTLEVRWINYKATPTLTTTGLSRAEFRCWAFEIITSHVCARFGCPVCSTNSPIHLVIKEDYKGTIKILGFNQDSKLRYI